MKLTGNTILITGGGTGIGAGLAAAFHKRGNKVIISGRRTAHLKKMIDAYPDMVAVMLDVTDPAQIKAVANQLITNYPELNVLINNAGVMALDNAATVIDDEVLLSGLTTNVMGPIRMTSAFIEHLKQQADAAVINVSSGMGFVPFAAASVYSASKAAVHTYSLTLRYQLRGSSVRVLELVPPWVRTPLLNSEEAPAAMPFDEFIAETMALLATDAEEILVERVRPLRNNAGANEHALVTSYNDSMQG